MSFTVCLIDDDLLQINRDSKLLSEFQIESNLSSMVPDETDEDYETKINLHAFIKSIVEEDELALYGYTNPRLYNESIGSQPAFDVVIYDWEYGTTAGTINPGDELKKLIDDSHCYVYVYSHMVDEAHQSQVNEIKEKNLHRMDFLLKGDPNSANILKTKIQEYKRSSFSAQFAQELRVNASKSVEKILVRLAHLNIDKFHQIMGTKGDEKRKDLVEFISEKFKNELMGMDFSIPEIEEGETAVTEIAEVPDNSNSTIKELWHYRMYSTIDDNRVRKGDIYKKSENEYIMIMTPNCQLVMYHNRKKTFGVFNYIKLIKKEGFQDFFIEHVELQRDATIKNALSFSKVKNSLIDPIGDHEAAPFFLPAVKISEGNNLDLLAFPKMFGFEKCKTSIEKKYLEKDDLRPIGYMYQTTLSEPFLSDFTKEVFDKLEGNGVPDYTDDMVTNIKQAVTSTIFS